MELWHQISVYILNTETFLLRETHRRCVNSQGLLVKRPQSPRASHSIGSSEVRVIDQSSVDIRKNASRHI